MPELSSKPVPSSLTWSPTEPAERLAVSKGLTVKTITGEATTPSVAYTLKLPVLIEGTWKLTGFRIPKELEELLVMMLLLKYMLTARLARYPAPLARRTSPTDPVLVFSSSTGVIV